MPNELLPTNIAFGTVVGRFGSAPLIAGDADGFPDFSPAAGLTVTFTPSTAAVIDATATPAPVTIEMVPIVCGLDTQGYLVGGDGQRGVKLIATNDTDINPSGWTYSVTFLRGGSKVAAFRDFSMSLPAGVTKDIALTIPVPSSEGVSLSQAQAAEAAAVSAASAAAASAAAAAASTALFSVDNLPQAGTTGKALAKATTTAAAQTAIGATTVGKALVTATDIAAGRDAIRAAFDVNEVSAGDPRYGTPGTRAAFIAALDAAEAKGKHTVVRIPNGLRVDVVQGLSLSGYSVQIKGSSGGITSAGVAASCIYASAQTGPVLDFTGYVTPHSFKGRVEPIANITIQGSGVADATKANSGLKFKALSSAYVHDIAIMDTGGPCLEMAQNAGNAVYLSDFSRIIMHTPVSAKANDVPYFYGNECNGNRFTGFGFRSTTTSADVGASGAAVMEGNSTYAQQRTLLDAWWFEFLHVPSGGTLLSFAGRCTTMRDFQFFDSVKESGATGTSFVRLLPTLAGGGGGNLFTGVIPGKGTNSIEIDTGIDVQQDGNSIIGIKDYRGNHVTLQSGVGTTLVHLHGSHSGASLIGWTDNSGTTTNHLIDEYMKTEVRPNGWKVNGVTTWSGTGSPEGVTPGTVGDLFTQTDGAGGHIVFVKGTPTGSTGWRTLTLESSAAATLGGVTQSLGFSAANCATYTLTANQVFSSVTGVRPGGHFTVIIKQDATGGRTVTWPATVKWAGNTAPTVSTAGNALDVFSFVADNSGVLRESSRAIGQS